MMLSQCKFRTRPMLLSVCLLTGLLGFQQVEASQSAPDIIPATDLHNEYAMLKYLWPTLKRSGKSGRIYYGGCCGKYEGCTFPFPKLNVHAPPSGASGLSAIRAIFKGDSGVAVTERPSGTISVTIGDVPDTILRTEISVVALQPIDQYNAYSAFGAIVSSKDVRAAMDKLGIHMMSRVTNMLVALPAKGLPHLPAYLSNMTMDQALDRVAQTFGGIVLYSICTKSQQYELDFTGGPDFDERVLQ